MLIKLDTLIRHVNLTRRHISAAVEIGVSDGGHRGGAEGAGASCA